MSEYINVDKNKCVGCSLCVKDCPNGHLYIEDKRAKTHESGCIECGHCYAICPSNAIEMRKYDTNDSEPVVSMTEFDSKKLLRAMKSRRTIRQYKDMPVEQEKIDSILEAGRYCPTAANSQNVTYTILEKNQRAIENKCIVIFRRALKILSPFIKIAENIEVDDDFFFKKAPLVIIVSSKSNINGGLASSYMELMAESLGLGVLFSGFFCVCYKLSPKIRKMVNLPKGEKIISCMVIGYPSVKYQRTVPRKPLKVCKR